MSLGDPSTPAHRGRPGQWREKGKGPRLQGGKAGLVADGLKTGAYASKLEIRKSKLENRPGFFDFAFDLRVLKGRRGAKMKKKGANEPRSHLYSTT